MDLIENRTLDEIAVGDRAEIERVLTQPDIALFATVSADINPSTLVDGEEEGPELTQGIAHGMWARHADFCGSGDAAAGSGNRTSGSDADISPTGQCRRPHRGSR
ncbi:hypothetical protein [Hoeflea alexandrii]|uniref:hypothetical protein n=1 Tax=Hoeflea alexandrii TaxID=288436 RepID=UPI002D1E3CEC|nr:hypothetical protein [Hoeflea alexandrii]